MQEFRSDPLVEPMPRATPARWRGGVAEIGDSLMKVILTARKALRHI